MEVSGVDLVYSRLSLRYYARKRVLRGRDSERSREAQRTLIGELSHLKKLSHRHLVKIIASYTDLEFISYIMDPVADLDLERLLALPGDFSPEYQAILRRFFGCLAGAVNYLHQSKIRHRDITARNILIYRDEVYISDFGSAYSWSNRTASATRHHHTPVSPDYQAPEIAKREARDSKSDIFSLGVVFLEMTTKLLGRSTAELTRVIATNARKHNSDQPYVYANLPVVLTWLDELRKGNTVEHDNEPLVWVRDLLQEKPRNRPSAKGLMKDILESPSFRDFCCFRCQGDFEERAFEYDAGLQRDEPLEDSTATKKTVANMFGEEASPSANAMSARKSESVEKWLGVTRIDGVDEVPMPGAFPDVQEVHISGARTVDDTSSLPSATPTQDWYLASEFHEGDRWYTQSILASQPEEDASQSYYNIKSPAGCPESEAADPTVSGHERNFHDTGLGFMEYASSDSDSEIEHQMFEEYSDASDTSSESESASATPMASGIHSNIKDLGIIVEVDELQSEEGASDQDDNNGNQFEEVSDDSTIDENTQRLGADLRSDKSEPVGDSLDPSYSIAQALSDVELSLPIVARRVESTCADMYLGESATKGPKAVTCEDDPEGAMSDPPRIPSDSTLDLGEKVLIEWPTEQSIDGKGTSTSDGSSKSPKRLEIPLETSAELVSRSSENERGTASPSSMTAQVITSECQIEYGNALISNEEHTLDLSPSAKIAGTHRWNTNIGSFTGETERTVRFALPFSPTPQAAESTLSLIDHTTAVGPPRNSLLPVSDESEQISRSSIVEHQRQQLEQAPSTEQKPRRPTLDNATTKRAIKTPKGPSDRLSRRSLTANTAKDGMREPGLIVYSPHQPAECQEPQDGASIPTDQSTRHVGEKSDMNTEAKIQPRFRIFYETNIRGVFSRELLPPPTVPQKQKARKAPLSKANLRALDTGKATDETESDQTIQSIPAPRLQLTAANVKALGDARNRLSPTRNKPSIQLHTSTGEKLHAQQNSPGLNDKKQDSGHARSSAPRSPRQRTALPAINAKSLMKTAWDSASASAPTSVMSEATKAKFSRILVPFDQFDRTNNLLRDYCKQGKASAVKFLLQKGCNPGTKKHPRRAPLLAAVQGASERHNKCVRELIKHDVDVNVKSKKSGKSALHLAVENDEFQGYVRLIWLLVNAGAETNMPDENGDLPLTKLFFGAGSLPLEKHRLEALAVLLQGGAEPNLHASGTGNTPLHLAVRRQDKWAVAMLLHKGADVNAKNSSGATPLQMTANQFRGDLSHDHAQVLDLLLQAKALIDETAGALSRTALHLAVTSGTAHAVKLLLDYGADPLLADKNGHTSIMLAIKGAPRMTVDPERIEDHVEVMDRLVKRLGPPWEHASNLQGVCAVEAAFSGDNLHLLLILLSKGDLDLRAKFRDGTILDFAMTNGTPEVHKVIQRYMFRGGAPMKDAGT